MRWPVDSPDAFAIVNVGNKAWGLAKFTPLSRTAAMAGVASGVTESARKPSGINKMRLRWLCAPAEETCSRMAVQVAARRADDRKDMAANPYCCDAALIRLLHDIIVTGQSRGRFCTLAIGTAGGD